MSSLPLRRKKGRDVRSRRYAVRTPSSSSMFVF